MCQTDEIHECFYELFNQRFRVIEDPKTRELKMFTNISIGAHTKASRVDKNFQCIVVISKSDLKNTPAPFLNRFEKYFLSYDSVYQATCMGLPPNLKKIVCAACSKVNSIVSWLNLSYLIRLRYSLKKLAFQTVYIVTQQEQKKMTTPQFLFMKHFIL